ncbi:MAG: CoA transferase [Geodermatophilaceae bacterium]|nr:CoA transferase [Geodermatophilaceae bacterium]
MTTNSAAGPLRGIRVLELAGLGAAPFAAMLLSDLGADVLRVDRAGPDGRTESVAAREGPRPEPADPLTRGRRSAAIDLKNADGVQAVLRLVESADVLLEGFRPGVTERLGIGPDECRARNPRLVYARMTGWGQTGPMADRAGHDINYIAVAGVLHPLGRAGERPQAPANLIGDFGGGGMLMALGICAALVERDRSGAGQVIDAAMVDGGALLGTFLYGWHAAGLWSDERGANLLDGGAPFYDTYETADGRFVSVGALEPQFYAGLLTGLGLADAGLPDQLDQTGWPVLRARFAAAFRTRTRDEWTDRFAEVDACVAPVLSLGEAPHADHNRERLAFVDVEGVLQPAPAPRFSRTPGHVQGPPSMPGQHTDAALSDWGFDAGEIADLRRTGAVS